MRELLRFISTIKAKVRGTLNQHRFDLTTGELIGEHCYTLGEPVGAAIGAAARAAGQDMVEVRAGVTAWLAEHKPVHAMPSFAAELAAIESRIGDAVDDDLARLQDCRLRIREAANTISRREITAGIVATRQEVQKYVDALADYCQDRWGFTFTATVPAMPPCNRTIRDAGCRAGTISSAMCCALAVVGVVIYLVLAG